jgi:hypothetical protein
LASPGALQARISRRPSLPGGSRHRGSCVVVDSVLLDNPVTLDYRCVLGKDGHMSTSAEIVAWACFGLGIGVLVTGVAIGYVLGLKTTTKGVTAKDAKAKATEALTKVENLKKTAEDAAKAQPSDTTANTADKQGVEAKSAIEQLSSIVGSLPENLRFSGLLILIGALLMSVATVQFGGHTIF